MKQKKGGHITIKLMVTQILRHNVLLSVCHQQRKKKSRPYLNETAPMFIVNLNVYSGGFLFVVLSFILLFTIHIFTWSRLMKCPFFHFINKLHITVKVVVVRQALSSSSLFARCSEILNSYIWIKCANIMFVFGMQMRLKQMCKFFSVMCIFFCFWVKDIEADSLLQISIN